MDELVQTIKELNVVQASEAVKNLRLSLQYHWKQKVSNDEAKQALQTVAADGESQLLRDQIVSEEQSAEAMERWGKSLLLFMAADEDTREYVQQAVDDALKSSTKDFGLTSLIVIGAVLVLLKWRPKKFTKDEKGLNIEWEDNDVSAVSNLAKLAGGGGGA
ncbi:MAG TPA: hypothetical protein VKB05_05045 [Pyrinomonadaceae bacterium]|nr:hypothetical protein [Pyrinomonadaceae bacterium]